jgi:hypothetical protein
MRKPTRERRPDGSRGGDLAVDRAFEPLQGTPDEDEVGALEAQRGRPGRASAAAGERDAGDGERGGDAQCEQRRRETRV